MPAISNTALPLALYENKPSKSVGRTTDLWIEMYETPNMAAFARCAREPLVEATARPVKDERGVQRIEQSH